VRIDKIDAGIQKIGRVVVLAIRRREIRAFQICTHFYCAIIGVSYTENPGYTPENLSQNELREF